MKILYLKIILSILLFSSPLMAMEVPGQKKGLVLDPEARMEERVETNESSLVEDVVTEEKYLYERALYLFFSGSYLASSKLSMELIGSSFNDQAQLLLRLSDSKLFSIGRKYSEFAMPENYTNTNVPGILVLLNTLYKMERYEECLAFARFLGPSGDGLFFSGMSLFRLNRLDEAKLVLMRILKNDRFYPYSIIAVTQIDVLRRDFKTAEKYLRERLVDQPHQNFDLVYEKGQLFLGYLLYEMGRFSDAIYEFNEIPKESPLYKDAVIGRIWSLLKLEHYQEIVDTVQDIDIAPPYVPEDLRIKIIVAFSYLKTGLIKEASDHFQKLMTEYSEDGRVIEKILTDKSSRKHYLSLLIDNDAVPADYGEEQYRAFLKGNGTLSKLLMKFEAIQDLKNGFIKMERGINSRQSYLYNSKSGLKKMLSGINGKISRLPKKLSMMNRIINKKTDKQLALRISNLDFYSNFENTFFEHMKSLNIKISDEVNKLVIFVMREWIDEGMPECVDSDVICFIISNLSLRDNKKEVVNSRQLINSLKRLELVSKDVYNNRNSKKIEYEIKFSRISEKAVKKIKKIKNSMEKLENIRRRIKINIMDIEKLKKDMALELDNQIKNSFLKLKYERAYIKEDLVSGLDITMKELKKERKKTDEK